MLIIPLFQHLIVLQAAKIAKNSCKCFFAASFLA